MALNRVNKIQGVLFDLDGTLIDSAPDIIYSINASCKAQGAPQQATESLRPYISHGADKLLHLALDVTPNDKHFAAIKEDFLNHYHQNIAQHSALFDGVENVLKTLNAQNIPWGIVTNKPGYLSKKLLNNFDIMQSSKTNIYRDTLEQCKPHPTPMLLASKELDIAPQHIIYIGDALTDIQAGKNANMQTMIAAYGYIDASIDIATWNADHIIHHADQIIEIIQ